MPIEYENLETLHHDDFTNGFDHWFHEGIGQIALSPTGGMRLHCHGSKQGKEGCQAFFRPTLPDQIAVEYGLAIRSQGGLLINFLAMRGINGEDAIDQRDQLEPRTGRFANYINAQWGLQSYHVSVSRYQDEAHHTGTSNWRRNPGLLLVGHGTDAITEIDKHYRIRIVKDGGSCQLFVDGIFAHAFIDRNTADYPIPDIGKFGFRLIGSDVLADIDDFTVYRVAPNTSLQPNPKLLYPQKDSTSITS